MNLCSMEKMMEIVLKEQTVKKPNFQEVLFFPSKENEQKVIK